MRLAAISILLAATSAASAQYAPASCGPCVRDFLIAYPAADKPHASMHADMAARLDA